MSFEPSDWSRGYVDLLLGEIGNILERGSGVVGSDRVRVIVGRDRKAMRSSEVVAVGSRLSIKEEHLSCYYTIVKRELICVNEEVKSDMWERKKGPLRRAQAQSTTHAQYQN